MKLQEKIFNKTDDYLVSLASPENIKPDCPVVNIPLIQLWKKDTILNKAKAFLKLKYQPNQQLIQEIANEIFLEEFFGQRADLAGPLFELMTWHQNRNWKLLNLNDSDIEKADALEAMTNLTRKRYWEYTSANLNLKLIYRQPLIAPLVYPVVAKIPIRTIQYFIDTHSRYAFDRIRRSKHQYSDEIVSYLYEVLILNQKTANKLHTIVKLIDEIKQKEKDLIMLRSEIDAISEIDSIIKYTKASVEKMTSLVGYTYGIAKLEDKKEHKKRLNLLIANIPELVKRQPYYEFFIEHISSKQLEKLNSFRTGILHKKGISKNQPQAFYGNRDGYKSLVEMFNFLFDQHCKNSTILIASVSLLTDKLVELDKPDFSIAEIPFDHLIDELNKLKAGNNT